MHRLVLPALTGLLLLFCTGSALAINSYDDYRFRSADIRGGSDHPALGRIPGSVLDAYDHADHDTLGIPGGGRRVTQASEASGETWFLHYRLPENLSPSAAVSIYRRNLEQAGLKVTWTCRRLSLSNLKRVADLVDGHGNFWTKGSPPRDVYCLVAQGTLDGRPTTVQVYAYKVLYTGGGRRGAKLPAARIYVTQARPLDTRLEVVTAEEMARAIESDGKVALYGIHFDHNSDRIKPESKETLDQIAALLGNDRDLKLYVVGHTDSTGKFDYNMDLSRRRAASVVRALVQRGVAESRLSPHGVGPLAPVASNATDEGRAKNRRVELVRQ